MILGSIEMIGADLDLDPKAPYHWRRQSKGRDAGDIPSARHMRRLLQIAKDRQAPLTAEHLIHGATRAEIEALLGRSGEMAA